MYVPMVVVVCSCPAECLGLGLTAVVGCIVGDKLAQLALWHCTLVLLCCCCDAFALHLLVL